MIDIEQELAAKQQELACLREKESVLQRQIQGLEVYLGVQSARPVRFADPNYGHTYDWILTLLEDGPRRRREILAADPNKSTANKVDSALNRLRTYGRVDFRDGTFFLSDEAAS